MSLNLALFRWPLIGQLRTAHTGTYALPHPPGAPRGLGFLAGLLLLGLSMLMLNGPVSAYADKSGAAMIFTTAKGADGYQSTLEMTDGPKEGSWIWSSYNWNGSNQMWQFYLEDEKTGALTIRPRDNAALCVENEWAFNAQFVRTYTWFPRLKYCSGKPEQRFFLQKTGTKGEYLIRRGDYLTECFNIWGGNRAYRPVVMYSCQQKSSGATNDRWWLGEDLKFSEWADRATLSWYGDDNNRKLVPLYEPVDKTTEVISSMTGTISPIIPGENRSTRQNASGINISDSKTWTEGTLSSFTWGMSQTISTQVQLGQKDVYSISFSLAFSSNQSWTTQTSTSNSYTATLVVPAYSTAWFSAGRAGNLYKTSFDVVSDLGDRYRIGPFTATVVTTDTSSFTNCTNQGIQNEQGYFTGAYPAGHTCLASWPTGISKPLAWADGVKHCDVFPENHVYVKGAPCLDSVKTTPPASTPSGPASTPIAKPIGDTLITGKKYLFLLNFGGVAKCLDYYQYEGVGGLWDCKTSGNENQTWLLDDPDQDGYRMIRTLASASTKCLVNTGTNISVNGNCGPYSDNSRWKFQPSNGQILNKAGGTGVCLTAPTSNQVLPSLQDCQAIFNQRWIYSQIN